MWKHFETFFYQVQKHVPSKTIKQGSRIKPPWIKYKSVLKATKAKRVKKVAANKSGLKADDILHEIAKENIKTTIKEAKLHYDETL